MASTMPPAPGSGICAQHPASGELLAVLPPKILLHCSPRIVVVADGCDDVTLVSLCRREGRFPCVHPGSRRTSQVGAGTAVFGRFKHRRNSRGRFSLLPLGSFLLTVGLGFLW